MQGELGRGPGVIRLAPSLVADLLAHALRERPRECCGVLLCPAGSEGPAGAADPTQREGTLPWPVPTIYHPGRNVAAALDRYELAPEDLLQAFLRSEEEGLAVWGFFHSHVASEAYPSSVDIASAHYPEAVYVILSLRPDAGVGEGVHLPGQGVLGAFRIRDGKVDEQRLSM